MAGPKDGLTLAGAILAGAALGWWSASDAGKSQEIRAVDVWLLGPLMIAVSLSRRPSPVTRSLLALGGAATITFNARNYLAQIPPPANAWAITGARG